MRFLPLTLTLLLTSLLSLAQNSTTHRVIDKKIHIPENLLELIENNKSPINRSLQSFVVNDKLTEDEIDDIELHAAINPLDSNNIIIAWMNMDISNSTMPLIFKMMYSEDFGQTWQESQIDFIPREIQANEAVSGGGDPVIAFDYEGNVYVSWLYTIVRVISNDEIYVDVYMPYAKSSNNGATWLREANGDDMVSSGTLDYVLGDGITGVNTGYFPDKQWMAVNPLNNDLFLTLTEFDNSDNYNTGLNTWGIRKKAYENSQFGNKVLIPPTEAVWGSLGALAINKDGAIHAIYPYYPSFPTPATEKLMHSVSYDNGQTFSTPVFIADIDVENFQGVGQENNTSNGMYDRLYPSSYIAIDTSSQSQYEGRMYVCWNSNDANYNKKVDVFLSYSDDNGQTWSTPTVVNTDPPRNYGFHHRPTITVNPDGKVILAWFDNRDFEVPNVYMNHYYYGISNDGGQTFEEFRLSHDAWNYNDSEFNSESGIGEYFQILSTKGYILAFYPFFDGQDTEIYSSIMPYGQTTDLTEMTAITNKIQLKKIYPNPFVNQLNIEISLLATSDVDISVYDTVGKLAYRTSKLIKKGESTISLDLGALIKGDYILFIDSKYGHISRKISKQK